MSRASVWLDCVRPGCPYGTPADRQHLANLTAPGDYHCHRHNTNDEDDNS